MAKEGKSKWVLDLDIKEFTAGVLKAKGSLAEMGDAKNFTGLTKNLLAASRLLGIVGAAAFALKTTFETVFAAEEIKAVNAQFDILAKNAGIAGDVIKDRLVGATGGLVDDEAVLKAAGEQIIKLGTNASKLPEIMELARKHTNAFGGDMLQKFEQISTAIANGQARQLKSLGIVIDQEKAYKEYAASIGKTVGMLSQEEKQRALLNATLDKGNKALKGIDGSAKEATLGWQKLMVTLGDLKDTVVLVFDRVFGPTVKRMISNMNVLAEVTSSWLKDNFGSQADQAKAKLQDMADKINAVQLRVLEMKAAQSGSWWDKAWAGGGKELERQTKYLERLRAEYEAFQSSMPKEEPKSTEGSDSPGGDDEKVLEQKNKFNQELLKMKQSRLDQELALSTAYKDQEGNILYEGEALQQQKILLLKEQTAAQIQAIRENDDLLTGQKDQMIKEVKLQEQANIIQMEEEMNNIRNQNLDRYLDKSTTTSEGVSRAWEVAAKKQRKEYDDMGKQGAATQQRLLKGSMNALHKIGAGQAIVAEAAKSLMYNEAADRADAKGKLFILEGVATYDYAKVGAGAGLVSLAGYLRSQGGGGSGGGGHLHLVVVAVAQGQQQPIQNLQK